ncbi:MAG: DNA repair protein RadA [Capsulimonas sp.]|uniref:DNA repair protein RadA n=1 Tax=Capsulimonas sp. TaxID=2494211 RepID=UPI0032674D0B
MAKGIQTRHVCRECGYETPKWLGKCPGCDAWGTLEESVTITPSKTAIARTNGAATLGLITRAQPTRLTDVPSVALEGRLSAGLTEFDRVLGGGIVPGALILVGGDPGIGKSTLLTQAAGFLANAGGTVLYVSGEESATQIKLRAERLGVASPNILLHNEVDVTLIASTIASERPSVVIIDSIQTMTHPEIDSAAGSVSQVRSCTAMLAQAAKGHGIPIFLVGHVTKEGALAGPRVLEHMVDTVLTFEGDRHYAYRVLRAVKNRFGSTDELGLFEMREEGLAQVANPSEMFLSERSERVTGSCVSPIVEGTRPLLVEVQALCAPSYLASPRRTFSGVDSNRVNLILAVLEKRAGLALAKYDVFVNIAGGVRVDEPSADLAIAVATASNFREIAVNEHTVVAGEVGLGGEVRAVGHMEQRLREAGRMGFKRAIVSARSLAGLSRARLGIEVIGVDNVHQAIDKAFRS